MNASKQPPDRPDRGQLAQLLGYHLRRASVAMMADFSNELAAADLRPVQFAILSLIGENKGINQTELCRELSVQKANMVPLVAELERRGLVTRKADARDRRIHRLTLTAKANRKLHVWRDLVDRHDKRFFARIDPADRSNLLRLLKTIWDQPGDVGGDAEEAGSEGQPSGLRAPPDDHQPAA